MDFASSVTSATTPTFLVRREGSVWKDVYALTQGKCVSIGRGDSNTVALADSRSSRRHCEVYFHLEKWHVRDVGSSNGTEVNDVKITESQILLHGDVIRVGRSEFLFSTDLDELSNSYLDRPTEVPRLELTEFDIERPTESPADPEILERRSQSVYCKDLVQAQKLRLPLAELYRLVTNMLVAETVAGLAEVTLKGLFDIVSPDIGAILVVPHLMSSPAQSNDPRSLKLIAFKAPEDCPYSRVSERLSSVAMGERDGILATDFSRNSTVGRFESLAAINAQSVLCVPIRCETELLGLIHLYSLTPEHLLDRDALEFTLAVGDHLGLLLKKLLAETELASSLDQVRRENEGLRKMLRIESGLIGESSAMRHLKNQIGRFAQADATVLVYGESGVGKELVARAIHFNSNRKDKPFVAVNCAALTESLLESELFGHEKGSFTGATERKIGKFEQAHLGTIFLDEIGEMNATMQAKFLRVLEGQSFERVGGHTPVEVQVRVVAATNRNLTDAVRDGDFRRDLFFRLNVLTINVPPLRDRREDIAPLVEHFLSLSAARQSRSVKVFSQDSMDALLKYDWPGNVRELRNVVERAFSMSIEEVIGLEDIQFSDLDTVSEPLASSFAPISLAEMEKRHIEATLRFAKWVKREAARILDIERSTLDRKLQSYDIKKPDID